MDEQEHISKELLLDILGNYTKLRKAYPYTILLYALPPEEVMKLLDVCQGTTITFPTKKELLECISFSIVQKYGSYETTPQEVRGDLTKRRYVEMLRAIEKLD